ncbi:MAG: transcription-repair coupling factor, partial [Cyanobacteria bacterium]|nr:transcription-repair coupling factor [Cyanobacteriota bacterium]
MVPPNPPHSKAESVLGRKSKTSPEGSTIASQGETLSGELILDTFLAAQWLMGLISKYQQDPQKYTPPVIETYLENLTNPSVKALLVSAVFHRLKKQILLVCPDPITTFKLYSELRHYLPDDVIERYPAEEFSPYDLSVMPVSSLRDQHRILTRMQNEDPCIILLSCKNLLLKHISFEETLQYTLELTVGQEIAPETLTQSCLDLGYLKTSLIMEPGEFSCRGDIFDLYPVNSHPVRISFFGETIESIRTIDIENQRSIQSIKSVTAIPRSGIVLSAENRTLLEAKLREKLNAQQPKLTEIEFEGLSMTVENQIQALNQAFLPDGIDYYGPLVHQGYQTVLDRVSENTLLVLDDWQVFVQDLEALAIRLATQYQDGIAKGRLLDLGFEYHKSAQAVLDQLQAKFSRRLYIDTFPLAATLEGLGGSHPTGLGVYPFEIAMPQQFKADLKQACEYLKTLRRDRYQVFVTTDHPQRLLDVCKEWDVPAIYWADGTPPPKDSHLLESGRLSGLEILIMKDGPHEGYLLTHDRIAHITDVELFGRKHKRILTDKKTKNRREDLDVIHSISELRQGDYVVHTKHGIGRFIELTQIKMDGEKREYLTIQYSGSDKLYVPVDQVNFLSRYRGAGDVPPKLSKMGGMEWSAVKKKVKKSIQSIAKDLIELYAARAKAKGFPFEPDSPWQVEMEDSFPYAETPDQWQAIQDAKRDMESDKPMDRLICGDVGFGKTEVAIRAIFKCVLSGKQAAVLVPTTILAQQHFNTLTERFQPYPVRIGLMSRFRSAKEQKEVAHRLSLGECDVVVGTHRLLQKDIKFKDMGLLVIDEEQRFGVAHKEKMKLLRNDVDVLTLSATPIPRTLYMSLSGVREMSLINTAPLNRAPIKTFVGPYNPAQIRMAILQEVDRGGQVYFVHNRVQTIYHLAEELKQLIPEVRFAVGHGQMNEQDLETVMLDFSQNQYDVLLCTTIIESGLDIPNANTIIVDRADRLGLAQLYQLRGRVGRSPVQAYAYCYYDPDRNLSEDAKDRLRAIREFTTLGSGYQIALRDLEIRGVGNILGSEQHGHMVAVGFDLYCEMLEESIEELQGKETQEKEDSIIDLNVSA